MKLRILASALLVALTTAWFVSPPTRADETKGAQETTPDVNDRFQIEGIAGSFCTGFFLFDTHTGQVTLKLFSDDNSKSLVVAEAKWPENRSSRFSLTASCDLKFFNSRNFSPIYFLLDKKTGDIWMQTCRVRVRELIEIEKESIIKVDMLP